MLSPQVTLTLSNRPRPPAFSNMTKQEFLAAVATTKEHIDAGDVFQLVLSQRFERRTPADPFEVYRSERLGSISYAVAWCCCEDCWKDAWIGVVPLLSCSWIVSVAVPLCVTQSMRAL